MNSNWYKKEKLAQAIEELNCNNYLDEANNITYTNGIRSIYKYCRKFKFNFKEVAIALYNNGCWSPAKFNIKTDGLEVI